MGEAKRLTCYHYVQWLTVVKFTTQCKRLLWRWRFGCIFPSIITESLSRATVCGLQHWATLDASYWDASRSMLLVLLRAFLADGIPLKTPELLTDVISLFALQVSLHFIRFQTVSCQSPEAQHTQTSSVISNHGPHESRMEICFVILDIGGPSSANIVCWDFNLFSS